MFEDIDPIVQAMTVITWRRHSVEPDDEFEHWRVDGGEWLTVGDMLARVIVLGLNTGVGRVQ